MIWYDKIAKYYDFFTYWFYKDMRKHLIENLDIKFGDRVLVVACGTGQNFDLIESKIGKNGEIVAIDYSGEMLKYAQKRIEKNNWHNIKLIHSDIRKIDKIFLKKSNIKSDFDIVIAELAFSVIPDWQEVMKKNISLLKKNGKLGILDWYRAKNDILTKIVNFLADAETTRKTVDFARSSMAEFTIIRHFFFKSIYIGIGKKQ